MSNVDQQSSYHLNLLEDKREEIQNIIKKRKRQAQFSTLDRRDDAKMGAFNVRIQAHNGALFPDITPKR